MTIHDNGYVFSGGTLYTFEARAELPNYLAYTTAQGVTLESIRNSVAAALARDGSTCNVPVAETVRPFAGIGSTGGVALRVNYRPVSSRGIVSVGTSILSGLRSLTPMLPENQQPRDAPMTAGLDNPVGFVPFVNLTSANRREVVESGTINIGQTNTAPTVGWGQRVNSDNPERNGNLGVTNQTQSGIGPGWTAALAVALGAVGLVVIGYSAVRVAALVNAVKA